MSELNPKTKHKEFNGLPGVLSISLGLPILLVFLYQLSNEHYHTKGLSIDLTQVFTLERPLWDMILDSKVWSFYLLWFFGLMILDLSLPGYHKQGVELRDGTKLTYLINGVSISLILIITLLTRFWLTQGELPELQFLYQNILELTIITTIFSALLATFVYIISFQPLRKPNGKGTNERILAIGGNTGNPIYDWFIGRELNPRIGSWDIKLFCELRPGMLLWLLINLSCLHQQWLKLGYITDSMILVNVLQAIYVFDGVLNEDGCLTMMDITTDGFGFMLSFGDLSLVPFSYSLQSRYLAVEPIELGEIFSTVVLLISFTGFYIFKSSNNQKSNFRQGKLSHLNSIQTQRSTKLLCDGWWGLSQHINYFGDWIHALSWSLSTGFITPFTYYYILYFASLLLHRQSRDEIKCKEKYGKSWDEYEKAVPYKIIPYVY
ncbi:Lamin-B receptor [Wickerhamomyces ciferrii]|uniref:Delta(14)-sterol reductase n=1 Tax=Wickerhamomyces ciferrii (strain ATCC 14091 / BCRC 22168 / CBS 111 / JCM 3599 / NBRC 0793 / NRRL Y-1031 F-60-10) TaxID=1206466 RepID=K0KDH5_WICCF|nr:Lamin-B receptor [Wickerhamomyces ciferrii]CCH43170.1 Lamin-B receptor [Wickerhamomyces ciferrii]